MPDGARESRRRLSTVPGVLAAVALAAVSSALLAGLFLAPDGRIGGRFADVSIYYSTGRAFLGNRDIYATGLFRQWPLVAALCVPLALLPANVAYRAGAALSLVMVIFGCVLLYVRLARERRAPSLAWLTMVAMGPALLVLVYLGQMSGACFAAFATGLALRRQPKLAGLCFAAMALKPHLALLAIPALASMAPEASATFLVGLLCWPLGSLLLVGWEGMKEYALLLLGLHDGSAGLVTVRLSGLLPVTGTAFSALQLIFGLVLIACLGTLWIQRLWKHRELTDAEVDGAVAVALIALPWAMLYDLLFCVPALLRLGSHQVRSGRVLMVLWWLLPLTAMLLRPFGLGGMLALLPPAIAVRLICMERLRPIVGVGNRYGGAFKGRSRQLGEMR